MELAVASSFDVLFEWVGGMLSRVLENLYEKSSFLASFIPMLSLVRSYISTSNSNIDPLLTLVGMHGSFH